MKKLFEPINWWFWILIALVFKSLLVVYYIHHIDPRLAVSEYPGFWGAFGGDAFQYLDPIEKLLCCGTYSPDDRMPGYGIIYYFFRLFLNPVHALNVIILLQLITSAISVYILGLTAQMIFRRKDVFYYAFFLFLFSHYAFSWDYLIITESFTVSFMVFFTFFLVRYLEGTAKAGSMLLAGFFLTWVVFLKPVYVIILGIVCLIIFIRFLRHRLKNDLLAICLFVSPFVLIDGAWVARNYMQYQKIIPLTTHVYISGIRNTCAAPLIEFMHSWGGDFAWDVGTDSRWFYPNLNGLACLPCGDEIHRNSKVTLPNYIYTSKFNYDTLLAIRVDLMKWDSLYKVKADSNILNDYKHNIELRLDSYTASVKQEKPFLYYVKSRFIYLKRFLTEPVQTTPLIFHPYNKLKISIFIVSEALYYFALITSLLAAIVVVLRGVIGSNMQYSLVAISSILIYGIFIFPLLKFSEHRYLAPEYPFIVLCSTVFFIKLREKFL